MGVQLPTWNILIPTLGQRRESFERLLNHLLPQVEAYEGRFLVTALWNNGEYSIGVIRQKLLDSAVTDYVSFIDDDDMVADFYVEEIAQALSSGPDHVGWIAQCYEEGKKYKLAYHSLANKGWHGAKDKMDKGLYRDFSHTNVMRTGLAKLGRFDTVKPGKAEDFAWTEQVRGNLLTEVYIDKVMYHYFHSRHTSTWSQQYQNIDRGPHEQLKVHHPYFRYHPESLPEGAWWNQ